MRRHKFGLSHYKLYSCDMGELIPAMCIEVLPGDTIQHAVSALVRASPMLAPVMHPVHIRYHCWYVPNRLIWEDWEDFITGGPDGMNASVWPHIVDSNGVSSGGLGDYLGLPVGGTSITYSALPFRAYALIWNEWYRDQDLQAELVVSKASGADTTTNQLLQSCNWEKDYFTSSRPWEQKGPTVTIPLTGDAPVGADEAGVFKAMETGAQPTGGPTTGNTVRRIDTSNFYNADLPVYADLSAVSGVTINDLREALAIQRFEEARARYGSRYVEYLRYLGVRSSDARLQRPEYLGGGKQTLQFSEVLQTGPGTDAVGTLRGHGIAAVRSRRYRRFIEEHGWVICLMTIKPRTMYMQGMHRHWNRKVKEDYWQRELQHIGQQAVLNREIFGYHGTPDGVFGYQDRYDEYRRHESLVGGEFRAATLNFWHFARDFASAPALNDTFVKCVPTERTFASSTTDVMYVMAMHSLQMRRSVAGVGTSYVR